MKTKKSGGVTDSGGVIVLNDFPDGNKAVINHGRPMDTIDIGIPDV